MPTRRRSDKELTPSGNYLTRCRGPHPHGALAAMLVSGSWNSGSVGRPGVRAEYKVFLSCIRTELLQAQGLSQIARAKNGNGNFGASVAENRINDLLVRTSVLVQRVASHPQITLVDYHAEVELLVLECRALQKACMRLVNATG